MTRSVPEKTLEHWASIYLSYRFRSHAGMWWPASGEDIDLRWLPRQPSKAVQLEMKTAEASASGHTHTVEIDLKQLWNYLQRPLGRQPFYVFPYIDWVGELEAAVVHDSLAATEVGFSRSGEGWWFAEWLRVLTTQQVAGVLAAELAAAVAAAGGEPPKQLKRFVRYHVPVAPWSLPVISWGHAGHATAPDAIPWRDFWTELVNCGRPGWPQLIRVPADGPPPGRLTRQEVLQRLRAAKDPDDRETTTEMWTLEPDRDGGFVLFDENRPRRPTADDGEDSDDHRQLVVLGLDVLNP